MTAMKFLPIDMKPATKRSAQSGYRAYGYTHVRNVVFIREYRRHIRTGAEFYAYNATQTSQQIETLGPIG
jgi:hypothetical protein